MTWNEIPNNLSNREAVMLQRLAEGRPVLELGSLLGASTVALAQTATEVVAVDKHTGYTIPTLDRFLSNLHRCAVAHKVHPVVADITDLQVNPALFQLAFIDLDGTYTTTSRALTMLQRIPVIAVHDVCRVWCAGVEQAVLESGRYTVSHVDSLVVLHC